ncbi:MAG: DUF3857 domain-containing protein [Bacteroidetes bacterium]|nr:DUF3857 domain-containing protein [Bacteroidota bacterium]
MKKTLQSFLSLCVILLFPFSSGRCFSADDVWKALSKHDRKQARELLNKAINDPTSKTEATMILMLLNNAEDKTGNLELMQSIYPSLDPPSPYIFAYWLDDAISGNYLKRNDKQLNFLKQIRDDHRLNSSITAGMNYILGVKYFYSNKVDEGLKDWSAIHALGNWQITGHFDNSSGSGFDKDYDPVAHPEPTAHFISRTNSDIYWFTPKYPQRDAWFAPRYYIPVEQGIVYGQTFINSPADQQVILTLGGAGSLKVWVNDQLVIRQEEELRTELDFHMQPVMLKKGYNRILVQNGFTDKTNFPNFLIRLLDSNSKPVEGLTSSPEYQPYSKEVSSLPGHAIPHFAEEYFRQKLVKNPDDLLSALLISEVYLRSKKLNEAINILTDFRKRFPDNVLIESTLLRSYSKLNDRTQVMKQIEQIRTTDPDLVFLAVYDFEDHIDKENFAEAGKDLEKIKNVLGEEDESYLGYKIRLLNGKKDFQEMISLIESAYKKYPENTTLLTYQFHILKNNGKNPEEPVNLLEKYLATNIDIQIEEKLISEYSNLNNTRKMEKHYLNLRENFPEEPKYPNNLAVFYYNQKDHKSALQVINRGLENAPFYSTYWSNRGYLNEALGNKPAAIDDLKKAIHYDPNLFDCREKVRQLQNKQPVESYFGNPDDDKLIQAALESKVESDRNFNYLFNEHDYVLYTEGASTEYSRMAVKMLNETGVKKWKESQISYNEQWQKLTIEKAEVRKKSGSKVVAEQNQNQLVFTSLEPGDVIYIIYRFENYTGGKLAKELWFDHVFNDFVPVGEDKLRLFIPAGVEFFTKSDNIDIQPKKTQIDDFTCYEWTSPNPIECKSESYMPSIDECGMAVHLSTVKSWKTISEWYRDIALPQAKEDYNLNQVFDKIFHDTVYTSDREKAKAIYNFICDNIRSSFISFRQSNYIPQTPMVTISTQLGDCKDLSTLFHTLAKKAGLKTHLVLVSTRDNGEENMKVPSTNFNHCIVRIDLKDGPIYQEFTDAMLGFGIMPNDIINAQALVIPNSTDDTTGTMLIHIPDNSSVPNIIRRTTALKVKDTRLVITSEVEGNGIASGDYRSYFSGLTKDELRETVKNVLTKLTGSNMILDTFSIENVKKRDLPVKMKADFALEGEIKSIGGMKVVKIPFFEKIFTLDPFPDEKRVHPIQYWSYESNDEYNSDITLELPADSKFVEVPESVTFTNRFISYSLTVEKLSDNRVKISRNAKINRKSIPASQYEEFRDTVKKVVKAEDMYIAYK